MAAFVKSEHAHPALQWELGNLSFLYALLHIVQKAWRPKQYMNSSNNYFPSTYYARAVVLGAKYIHGGGGIITVVKGNFWLKE